MRGVKGRTADQTNDWKHLQRPTYAREQHTDHLEAEMRRSRKRCASKIQGEGAEIKRRRGGRPERSLRLVRHRGNHLPPARGGGGSLLFVLPPSSRRGASRARTQGLKALRAVRSRRPLGAGDPRVCETAERERTVSHTLKHLELQFGGGKQQEQLSSQAALRT